MKVTSELSEKKDAANGRNNKPPTVGQDRSVLRTIDLEYYSVINN